MLAFNLHGQTNSVLANGQWVKMEFTQEGVYRINRATLTSMGFDVTRLDPRKLAIYGNQGGMLPQSLSISRPQDLTENRILVTGESDGTFNSEDFLLFYVDNVDELLLDDNTNSFSSVQNIYSDNLSYFITLKNEEGLRIQALPDLGDNQNTINSYNKIIRHEADLINILGSGREWFGEGFGGGNTLEFNFSDLQIAQSHELKLTIKMMSQAFGSTSVNTSLNDQSLGTVEFQAISNSRYGIKGNEAEEHFSVNTSTLSSTSDLSLNLTFNRKGINNAVAYLNSFLIDVPSQLRYNSEPLIFRSINSLDQSISNYTIANASSNLIIWDITNPLYPKVQSTELSSTNLKFGAFSDQLHSYIVFNPTNLPVPTIFENISNQDLRGASVPDLVIITAAEFLPQANRLAEFRRIADQLEVLVTSPQEIYNEFSSGRPDISAIRDYMYHLKEKSDRLKYLLLFGKGSYDYKDRIDGNTNFVPTYEARSSLNPLTSYSSDDFFGFLENTEGEWTENRNGDHTLEIGIGRIPATNTNQAKTAVDKIINYQNSISGIGDWRRRIVFVADDGDNNLHQRDADRLATLVDTTYAGFNVRKIYLDAFEQVSSPNGEASPKAENALLDAVDQGVLIMNFTGHGAETGWMQERILTIESIANWKNPNRLPLVVTATCEFGRNDDPLIVSGAEELMFRENAGAIGLVTTARPVFSSSNYTLNLALYGSILERPNGEFQRLGDIIRFTKNNALNGANNRNFILLGDPSMRLNYPNKEITITKINGIVPNAQSDTLRAMQRVRIEGEIERAGQIETSFNGNLNFSLFDKRNNRQTIGTESSPFSYLERDSQLFNGTASVIDGHFTIELVVPKNINYQFGSGKMSMYAFETDKIADAFGAKIDFTLGGTAKNPATDLNPPEVKAYINDTSAVKKIIVKRDASLLLQLFDENGINISESGIGQNLSATLNDSITYNLNNFYRAKLDDFQKGQVNFPMRNLPLGINRLEIRAWDNFNNLSKTEIQFEVTSENSTLISEINSYPNPFVDHTTFSIVHNGAGEALELTIDIVNAKGGKVITLQSEIEIGSNTETITWNGTDKYGSKLSKGIYIYNVILRSTDSGKTHVKRQKLIISN
ncbi:MAG: hypothetical protein ACJAXB_000513 [Candidatus Endobugula sp.]|jgi:hypothetical protein